MAVAFVTCSEPPTGPGGSSGIRARVAFNPVFSAQALEASATLRQAGVALSKVRVTITRAATGDTLFTREQAIGGTEPIQLEASFEIQSAGEQVVVTIDYLDAAGVVLFTAMQQLSVTPGDNPGTEIDTALVDFVGPGAGATSLAVLPLDTTISTATTVTLAATAQDAAGNPIANPLLAWSSSDASVATVIGGIVTPTGVRGSVQITAKIPTGVDARATVRMIPPPARVVVVGGDAQAGAAGSTLAQPFTVEVQAADGLPVAGETVSFAAVTDGGSVTAATATTDAQGRASTAIVLGNRAGTYQFRAVSGSLPAITISATASAAPASQLTIVSGDGQSAEVGTAFGSPLVVRATDAFGNAAPDAVVRWSRTAGSGALAGETSQSAQDGLASMAYSAGDAAGTDVVVASIDGGGSAQFSLTTTLAPATGILVVSGDAQSGAPGAALAAPLVVQVVNRFGAAVANETVTWMVASGDATVGASATTTTTDGTTQNTVTLGTPPALPATATVTATLASGATASFTATIAAPAGNATKLVIAQQPPATAQSGVVLAGPVKVQLAKADGSPHAQSGRSVTAAVFSIAVNRNPADGGASSASLSGTWSLAGTTTVSTDASGIATFANLAISGPTGPVVLNFSADSLASVNSNDIDLQAGPLASIAIRPAAPTAPIVVTTGDSIRENYWIESLDAAGNRVPGAAITFTARAGGPTGPLLGDSTLVTNAIGELPATSFPFPETPGTYYIEAAIAVAAAPVLAFTVQVNPAAVDATLVPTVPAFDTATDTVLSADSLSVRLLTSAGAPIGGAAVEWSIPAPVTNSGTVTNATTGVPLAPPAYRGAFVHGGDTLHVATTTTDSAGYARVVYARGNRAGPTALRVHAVESGAVAEFNVEAAPGLPFWAFSTNDITGARAGLAFPSGSQPVVQLYDAFGNVSRTAGVTINAYLDDGYGCEIECSAGSRAPVSMSQATATGAGSITHEARAARLAALRQRAATMRTTRLTRSPQRTRIGAGAEAGGASAQATTLEYYSELLGTTHAVTDADGRATFSDLAIAGRSGADYVIEFWDAAGYIGGSYPSCRIVVGCTTPVLLAAGEAEYLDLSGTPSHPVAGEAVTITAQLVDDWGNDVAEGGRTIAWTAFAQPANTATTGLGAATSITASDGRATNTFTVTGPVSTQFSVVAADAANSAITGDYWLSVSVPLPDAIVAQTPTRVVLIPDSTKTFEVIATRSGVPMANVPIRWTLFDGAYYTTELAIDTTDAAGKASLSHSVSSDDENLTGRIITATAVDGGDAVANFQVAVPPDGTYGSIWFGEPSVGYYTTSSWNTAGAWEGGVPTSSSSVLIPQWGYEFTYPHLESATTLANLHAYGTAGYAYLDARGHDLTVAGSLVASELLNGGVIRLTGTGNVRFYSEAAQLHVAPGANVTVQDYVEARSARIEGVMSMAASSLYLYGGDLTVYGPSADLRMSASSGVYGALNVVFEGAATTQMQGSYIELAGNFIQKSTYSPASFRPGTEMEIGLVGPPGGAAIQLDSPSQSHLAQLYVANSDYSGLRTITTSKHLRVTEWMDVYENVRLEVDSLTVEGDIWVGAEGAIAGTQITAGGRAFAQTDASLAELARFVSTSTEGYFPEFDGAPPTTTIVEATSGRDFMYAPAAGFNNLVLRDTVQFFGQHLPVSGNLTLEGTRAVLVMSNSADRVTVMGHAILAGGRTHAADGTAPLMTAGRLDFHGNVTVDATNGGFMPQGTSVLFRGASPQTLVMTGAGTGPADASFGSVGVLSGASVVQSGNAAIRSVFDLGGAWTVGSGGALSAPGQVNFYDSSAFASSGTVAIGACARGAAVSSTAAITLNGSPATVASCAVNSALTSLSLSIGDAPSLARSSARPAPGPHPRRSAPARPSEAAKQKRSR